MSADRFGTPIQNALLLGLRQRALDKLLPHLQQVPLTLKDTLEIACSTPIFPNPA